MTKFLEEVAGDVGSGVANIKFTSGATSTDLKCAQFFMKMQDDGSSIEDARAYAKVGPMLSPTVDWDEITRILDTYS